MTATNFRLEQKKQGACKHRITKTSYKYITQAICIIAVILAVVGCEETFDSPPHVTAGVVFSYTSGAGDVPQISVSGLGMDSLLVRNERTEEISLPLSLAENSTFVLLIDSIADTLTIYHTNTLNYESVESGFYHDYTITDVKHTYNRIESTEILNDTVTTSWNENIELYLNDLPSDTGTN